MIRNLLIVAVLLFSLRSAGYSAEKILIRTLAIGSNELPELFIHTGKEYLPLRFSTVQPSDAVTAPASRTLPIFRASADSDDGFEVVHRLKLPQRAGGILLLGWESDQQAGFFAVADPFSKAGYSDWLLVNASRHPVVFKAGSAARPLLLKPGVSCTHRVSAEKGKGLEVSAGASLKGKARTFYSTFWPVHGDKRNVVIFFDDGERIRVKRISDVLSTGDHEVTAN